MLGAVSLQPHSRCLFAARLRVFLVACKLLSFGELLIAEGDGGLFSPRTSKDLFRLESALRLERQQPL